MGILAGNAEGNGVRIVDGTKNLCTENTRTEVWRKRKLLFPFTAYHQGCQAQQAHGGCCGFRNQKLDGIVFQIDISQDAFRIVVKIVYESLLLGRKPQIERLVAGYLYIIIIKQTVAGCVLKTKKAVSPSCPVTIK